MTYTFDLKRIPFLLLLGGFLYGCNYKTESKLDKTSTTLPNGKHITIEKTNKETTSTGIFTRHDYGTSHSFTYKLFISSEDINWNGGSGEPKNIIFCNDTTYISYLKEKSITTQLTDSTKSHHYETQTFFQKHIDKRYFFKSLGSDYWVDITAEDYSSIKKKCEEYDIPNDNELSLETEATP